MHDDSKAECGNHSHRKAPCSETLNFYQLLSVNDDDDIHFVLHDAVKMKDKRCQTAFKSVRNLASHIDAVSYANFKASTDKWEHHKLLPKVQSGYWIRYIKSLVLTSNISLPLTSLMKIVLVSIISQGVKKRSSQ